MAVKHGPHRNRSAGSQFPIAAFVSFSASFRSFSSSDVASTHCSQYAMRVYNQQCPSSINRQSHQLFQRDAQTIMPEALENVKAALASSKFEHKAEAKKKVIPRKAAGQSWEDPTLAEWLENDYQFFLR